MIGIIAIAWIIVGASINMSTCDSNKVITAEVSKKNNKCVCVRACGFTVRVCECVCVRV